MDKKEIEARARKEQNRIKRLLNDAGISENRKKMLEPIILNTAWM